jgi:hypothetical protein
LELPFYTTQRGTLNAGEVATWQFRANANDLITLKVLAVAASEPSLLLQTLDGVLLAQGGEIQVSLPAADTYLVRVVMNNNAGGSYELGLSYTNRVAATELPVVGVPTPTPAYADLGAFMGNLTGGQILTGTLTDIAPEQVYLYTGNANEFINIALDRVSGTLDPLLTLYDPSGQRLALDDDSGANQGAQLRNIKLPLDGSYSVQVSGGGFYGDYQLRLTEGVQILPTDPPTIPTATATQPYVTPTLGFSAGVERLQDHAPVLGNIARAGEIVRYTLYATAGELISVAIQPAAGSGFRPQVEIYGPEGTLITSGNSSNGTDGGVLLPKIPIAESGAYLLFVAGENNTLGNFVLSYGVGASHTDRYRGNAAANERITGEIMTAGYREVWTLPLGAGDVLTVAVNTETGGLDPMLQLVAPDGTILYSDDNSGGSKAALIRYAIIPVSGIYTVRVRDTLGTQRGIYTLVWRYINLAPSPTPIPSTTTILTIDGEVAENAYMFYVFQGRLGQTVRVQITTPDGSTLDPVAVLLAPDGSRLAEGDDSPNSLNPDFTARLPDDGTYTVRVNGYLSGGAFTLRVALVEE